MDINIPLNIKDVIDRLEYNGFEAYIVGGCVRDSLMGIVPKDYDIATSARPEQVIECFSEDFKVIETGIQHGTVTVVSDGENVEVTTFRVDGVYSDHRRPDSVEFTAQLEDDLARRDFTINAMAYSDKCGIIDKFGGQKDLFNHLIRCVGTPEERFEEDALRIMRALRFASRLGFTVEKQTASAIHRKRSLLKDISAERISKELEEFVCGQAPCDLMVEFDDVFCTVIPEFSKCIGFNQHSRYHVYDVWEHTAHAVENSRNDRFVRLALLFHDIDKPICFTSDEEGQGHFPGHEKKSAESAGRIMQRLRFDKNTINTVETLIKYHYITPVDDKRVIKHLISVMGADNFALLMEVMKGDSRAKQSFCLERVNVLDAMKFRAYEILDSGECCTLKELKINGNDLEEIGFEGRDIGRALETLLTMVIDGEIANEREELIDTARSL